MLSAPSWNSAGKKSLKGSRKCPTSFWQILICRQHSTQPVGRDFFWSGPNATWAGLAGIRKLRSSLHADNKCKCYLWQVQTYCSCYSEVAEQALLFFFFYSTDSFLLRGWISQSTLGCNFGCSFPNTLRAKWIISFSNQWGCLSDLLIFQALP